MTITAKLCCRHLWSDLEHGYVVLKATTHDEPTMTLEALFHPSGDKDLSRSVGLSYCPFCGERISIEVLYENPGS